MVTKPTQIHFWHPLPTKEQYSKHSFTFITGKRPHEDKGGKAVIYEPRKEVSEQTNPADTLILNT